MKLPSVNDSFLELRPHRERFILSLRGKDTLVTREELLCPASVVKQMLRQTGEVCDSFQWKKAVYQLRQQTPAEPATYSDMADFHEVAA